jgi:DNA-binding response OmpR family regulator
VLFWAHQTLPVLPPVLEPVRVAARIEDLLTLGPADVLLLGRPGFECVLGDLPAGGLLLSWLPELIARGRQLGWRALQLPGPELGGPEPIVRAVLQPDGLVPVERGTLDPGEGQLWTAEGAERLPPRELEVLARLLEAAPGLVPHEALPRAEGVLRRLRARLGERHIRTVRGQGVRFHGLSPAPAQRRALPVRPPALVGGTLVDLDGQRLSHEGVEVRLSAREAEALARLLSAPGVVSRHELAVALGLARAPRRALDLAVHRLRTKLAPLELRTVRGQGYRLVRELSPPPGQEPEPTGLLEPLMVLLATERLVTVTGPCGVGKSQLARQAVARLGLALELDLHGVDPRFAARLLSRRVAPCGLVLLDGLDDAAELSLPLAEALEQGHRLLVTARAPSRLPQERELRVPPWPLEALRRLGPATDEHDGLPAALLEPDGLASRLASAPAWVGEALGHLSVLGGAFDEEDALAAGCERSPAELARLGWLSGSAPWRLWRPLRAALVSRWQEPDRARHARVTADRARRGIERCPYEPQSLEACLEDLVMAHTHTGDPELALLRADVEQELGRESSVDWLVHAVERAQDPELRSSLLHQLAWRQEGARLDLLVRSVELARGRVRLERQLELAYYLAVEGRLEEAHALMAEADEVLAGLPPDAWLFGRAELAILRSKFSTDFEAHVRTFADLLSRLEAARWKPTELSAGHRMTLATQRNLCAHLGEALTHLQRYPEAEVALRDGLATVVYPDGKLPFLQGLAELASYRRRWAEADRLLVETEASALRHGSPGWAIQALLHRALYWVYRGEPSRGDPLIERARALPGRSGELEGLLHYVEAHRAAARGDPEGTRRHGEQISLRIPPLLAEALQHVAEAVAAHQRGEEVRELLEALAAQLPGLGQHNPRYPVVIEDLLAHAGVVRPSWRARTSRT